MAKIVMVHGAFNELWGPHELKARWLPALRDGLWHHGEEISDDDVALCFYGDLFRRQPRRLGLHRHLRLNEIGKHVELCIFRDEDAVNNQANRQRDDHAAVTEGKFNESSKHDLIALAGIKTTAA